ncbi:MAG TPA: hypothetical protein PKW95_13795 [bacterium]|nr:hypothetical protein [bacterium]
MGRSNIRRTKAALGRLSRIAVSRCRRWRKNPLPSIILAMAIVLTAIFTTAQLYANSYRFGLQIRKYSPDGERQFNKFLSQGKLLPGLYFNNHEEIYVRSSEYLIKLDQYGNELWSQMPHLSYLKMDRKYNFYYDSVKDYFAKADADGFIIWKYYYNGMLWVDNFFINRNDQPLIIAYIHDPPNSYNDSGVTIIQLDDEGRPQWEYYFSTEEFTYWDTIYTIFDQDNNLLLLPIDGSTTDNKLYKFAPDGELLWQRDIDFPIQRAVAHDIGIIYLAGDDLLTAVDMEGSMLWQISLPTFYSGAYQDDYGMYVDSAGNLMLATSQAFPDQELQINFTKVSPDGEIVWSLPFNNNSASCDSHPSAAFDYAGNAIIHIVGCSDSSIKWRIYKVSPDGELLSEQQFRIDLLTKENDIVVDPKNNLYISNRVYGYSEDKTSLTCGCGANEENEDL